MADGNRFQCTNCGQAIYNCMINGKRVPVMTMIVVSQPDDTGEPVNWSDVEAPAFMRELDMTPLHRIVLCAACTGKVLRLPNVKADAERMEAVIDESGIPVTSKVYNELPAAVGKLDRERLIMRDVLKSLAGKELAKEQDLPPESQHFDVVQHVQAKAQARVKALHERAARPMKVAGEPSAPAAPLVLPPAV